MIPEEVKKLGVVPDRTGTSADGWSSCIWQRGKLGLRIRWRGPEAQMNEYENGSSTRLVTGDLRFCCDLAKWWFSSAIRTQAGTAVAEAAEIK